ncbi:MAG: GAF domain-containing sensor histidine kinase [Elusimicrobiota bacterium]|nr:GAF domain-containing sensor histidine kinase [Elusimicrobiota bacterium]
MSAIPASHAFALAALAAACSAMVVWWLFVFRKALPLEREAASRAAELADARAFAAELLDLGHAARRPGRALVESAERALGAVHRRAPGLALAALLRRDDGTVELLARRGDAWSRVPAPALSLETGFLAAASDGPAFWRLGAASEGAFTDALAGLGFSAARGEPWGQDRGARGVIIATEADPAGASLERAQPLLSLAARSLAVTADVSEGLTRLTAASARLEGGLTAAMAELSQTHDRLIRKSREVKTLHDVAKAAVGGSGGQALSTLGAIVSIVARSLEADLAAFLILDESTGELVTQPGAWGLEGEELLYRIPLTDERSSSVRVFKTRRPFLSGDAQNDPNTNPRYAKLWHIHSLMVVPLVLEDRCIGVMRVGSKRANAFAAEHLALVTVIAEEAAILVETALLNRRLSQTAEQLAALNRMKDEFVSTVSHEFKTPLTTITGFLTVMLEGDTGALNPQQMKFLSIAKAAAKRLSGLVSDLLDLSRLEGGAKMEMRALDLGKLVAASVENHQPVAAEAGKTLSCEAPVRECRALADERWIGLVVDNLVSNAIKFTNAGGRIRVKLQDKGEFLMVSVSDDGIGIPPQDHPRLFERFYRASNRGEVNAPGTGLGLSIAREVVSKHGGKIWFESALGKGTTFHFVVPAAPRDEAQKPAEAAA